MWAEINDGSWNCGRLSERGTCWLNLPLVFDSFKNSDVSIDGVFVPRTELYDGWLFVVNIQHNYLVINEFLILQLLHEICIFLIVISISSGKPDISSQLAFEWRFSRIDGIKIDSHIDFSFIIINLKLQVIRKFTSGHCICGNQTILIWNKDFFVDDEIKCFLCTFVTFGHL